MKEKRKRTSDNSKKNREKLLKFLKVIPIIIEEKKEDIMSEKNKMIKDVNTISK